MAGTGIRHTTNPLGSRQAADSQTADMPHIASAVDKPQISEEANKPQNPRQQTCQHAKHLHEVDITQIPQEADRLQIHREQTCQTSRVQ
jgi:hypothetical protein